jgi:mannose-6-phosphate isomerase-like protein (cupin superfamily)
MADAARSVLADPTALPWKQPKDLSTSIASFTALRSIMLVGKTQYGALLLSDECYAGMWWLAPHSLYPSHAHEASETFIVLSGGAAAMWTIGNEASAPYSVPDGGVIRIPTSTPHAVTSGDEPLLCWYVWTGALSGRYWFVDDAEHAAGTAESEAPSGDTAPNKKHKTGSDAHVAPLTSGYLVLCRRTADIAAIEWNMFTDMRPDERDDAMEALRTRTAQYDTSGEALLPDLDEEGALPQWVSERLQALGPKYRRTKGAEVDHAFAGEFASLDEANRAAKEVVEKALTCPELPRHADMVHKAEGDRTIAQHRLRPDLYGARPAAGSGGRLDKYSVPPSDAEATVKLNAQGLATCSASLSLYCDPFGADLYNVVRATVVCHVEDYVREPV